MSGADQTLRGDALIGCTGFVGTSLLRDAAFAATYHSRNIDEARGRSFRRVVCAAAPATMWLANQDPAADRANILRLIDVLGTIRAEEFVLVSTIAVLDDAAAGYTEAMARYEADKPYGRHRRELERFVEGHFARAHVLRLPALFGPGLKKNFLFDLLNPAPSFIKADRFAALAGEMPATARELVARFYALDDKLGMWALDRARLDVSAERLAVEAAFGAIGFTAPMFTNSASTFQYYGLHRLAADIDRVVGAGLPLVHVCSAPLAAGFLSRALTGHDFVNAAAPLWHEDMRSDHAALFGSAGPYLYDEASVLADLGAFFAAERAG